ncbi:MAG: hypothetical protein EP329_25200 [Deltaproteobacteria bacterium]|nr:MAG: hypothetical protein EP329_25200 [Deltaproteobacteria bacterium]
MHRILSRVALALTLTTALATIAPTAQAAPDKIRSTGKIGLGLGSGTLANGLSAKWYMGTDHALQFNLGSFGGGGIDHRWHRVAGFAAGVDYLLELPDIVTAGNAFVLGWNAGVGGALGVADGHADLAVAVAGIVGLEFRIIPVPIDIVLEFRPGLLIIPDVDFDAVDFTAHIRFYF